MATRTQSRSKQAGQQADEREKEARKVQSQRIEWVVGAVSAVVTLVLAGFLLFEAITKTGQEPDIAFGAARGFPMSQGYGVEVTVRNLGHVTAADVELEAVADFGGESETGTVTVDYLPAESETQVGFGFSREVDPAAVNFRLLGYTYP